VRPTKAALGAATLLWSKQANGSSPRLAKPCSVATFDEVIDAMTPSPYDDPNGEVFRKCSADVRGHRAVSRHQRGPMTSARPDFAIAIDPGMTVDELMRKWPMTIRVFIRWRMKCIGCPFGVFHTIEHACKEHSVERSAFLAALVNASGGADP
jgi:hybrid cluster-associated redox disulfide protein